MDTFLVYDKMCVDAVTLQELKSCTRYLTVMVLIVK